MGKTAGRQCHHCKSWVAAGAAHDCWTTTEAALTRDLPEHLLEAWQRLRESAAGLGAQRIYASHHSIMFSRKACYCFVRPKRSLLEVCFFLGRTLTDPRIHRVMAASRSKIAHLVHVIHRDQVEAPLTDWLEEAYRLEDAASATLTPRTPGPAAPKREPARRRAVSKPVRKRKSVPPTRATAGTAAKKR
jgi:hypothetical protein